MPAGRPIHQGASVACTHLAPLLQAKLRREAVAARKEASQLRLELAKVSRSSEHRVQEASCLKAALKGRDVLLEEMQGRVKQQEDELAR